MRYVYECNRNTVRLSKLCIEVKVFNSKPLLLGRIIINKTNYNCASSNKQPHLKNTTS